MLKSEWIMEEGEARGRHFFSFLWADVCANEGKGVQQGWKQAKLSTRPRAVETPTVHAFSIALSQNTPYYSLEMRHNPIFPLWQFHYRSCLSPEKNSDQE